MIGINKGCKELVTNVRFIGTQLTNLKSIKMKLKKYNQNLRVEGTNVYSYNTHVATIIGNTLKVLGWWSVTTSKHVSYVASQLGLTIVK